LGRRLLRQKPLPKPIPKTYVQQSRVTEKEDVMGGRGTGHCPGQADEKRQKIRSCEQARLSNFCLFSIRYADAMAAPSACRVGWVGAPFHCGETSGYARCGAG